MGLSQEVLHGVPLTRENFAVPPPSMGILPFWFWNGEMDEREMEWQLREYRAKGITGLFIHGRFGLKVPYVSDAWFEKVKVAVKLARKIGIDAWIYDEMNWPSGTAERKVPRQFPHLTQKYLELVPLNVDGPLFTFLEATDSRYVNTGDSYPIAAVACTEEEFQTQIRKPIDLTQNLSFERVIPWEAPEGKWRLLYFLQKEATYYIDALNPESTRRFLDLTHERYRQSVGQHFGDAVPGFYTDEPAMHYYQVGVDNYVVPWTSQMFKIFRERRGYDLRPFLPALYLDMGPDTVRVRYDFWRTLTEQYAESYYAQIRAWCDANGVIFTGHLLFEEWLRMHARCEGNLFAYLRHMHLIGVDHLYPKIGTKDEPDQHVALKIASSAAHHFGSTRLLCESMGGSYWDCSLQRMKWIANWEYVLGVNLFNNHGYHYSIEGERKRDWPPSQFYHHTWWKHYGRFTEYMSRMSHVLSGGRHVANVLMLYPLASVWTNYVPQKRTDIGDLIEADFCYLTDLLLRLHHDFDYVDEEVLVAAVVKDGTIMIRDEIYSVLFLPPITHCKESTFAVLEKFVQQGGTLIADTLLPLEFLETERNDASARVRGLFGVSAADLLARFHRNGPAISRVFRNPGKRNVFVWKGNGLHRARPEQAIDRLLRSAMEPDVTISDEQVFYLHRVKDGFDLYYLVNTATSGKTGVEVTFAAVGTPELWDLSSGEMRPMPAFQIQKGRLYVTLDFPPAEARILSVRKGKPASHVIATDLVTERFDGKTLAGYARGFGRTVSATVVKGSRRIRKTVRGKARLSTIPLPKVWDFHLEGDNALLISRLRMAVEENASPARQEPPPDGPRWLEVKPGAWEMQLPQERDAAVYPAVVWYRATFDADVIPQNLRMLIDGFSGSAHTLFVNGHEVQDPGRRSTLDAEIKEIDIASLSQVGRNTISVRLTATRRTDGILDPIKLVGDFALESTSDGYRIIRPKVSIAVGDWTSQGYPFFSGTGVYRTEVTIPAKYLEGRMELQLECGEDVAEVVVDGRACGVLPWHPYQLEVTGSLKPGQNVLEVRITNTLINVLEGVLQASGMRSVPVLEHRHRYLIHFV